MTDGEKKIRPAVVAGSFYPDDPKILKEAVLSFLSSARTLGSVPKALIVPHAGYVYSAPVAAEAYARFLKKNTKIKKVVLMGPSHRVGFHGIATTTASAYETPLGVVAVNREILKTIEALPQVIALDQAHANEHCLEVQIPFLQTLFEDFSLIPLVVGEATPQEVGEVLLKLWGDEQTLIVISSDLSHYLDYATAVKTDTQTCGAIEALNPQLIKERSACGARPIQGLLTVAKQRQMSVETIALKNSGDTAGPKDRVVGYGAWGFFERT